MWIGNEWVTRSSGREPVSEVAEDKAELYAKLAEMAEEAAQVERGVFGCIHPEGEPPADEWDERAYLWAHLDILDDELDESGIEDATEWERFPEMERVLGVIAEYELGWR